MKIGIDWDGVGSEGFIPPNTSTIVTNRSPSEKVKMPTGRNIPVYYNQSKSKDPISAGLYKSRMAQQLGLTHYYDDNPTVTKVMKNMNPNMNIFLVKGKNAQLVK